MEFGLESKLYVEIKKNEKDRIWHIDRQGMIQRNLLNNYVFI